MNFLIILCLHFFYTSQEEAVQRCSFGKDIPDFIESDCPFNQVEQIYYAPCVAKATEKESVIIVGEFIFYEQKFSCKTNADGNPEIFPKKYSFKQGCVIPIYTHSYKDLSLVPRTHCKVIRRNDSLLVNDLCIATNLDYSSYFENYPKIPYATELTCANTTQVRILPHRCPRQKLKNAFAFRDGCFEGSGHPSSLCYVSCDHGFTHRGSQTFQVTCNIETKLFDDDFICEEILDCRMPFEDSHSLTKRMILKKCDIRGNIVNGGCRIFAAPGHAFSTLSIAGDDIHVSYSTAPKCKENRLGMEYWRPFVEYHKLCKTVIIPDQDDIYYGSTGFSKGCKRRGEKIYYTMFCFVYTEDDIIMNVNNIFTNYTKLTCADGVASAENITFFRKDARIEVEIQ